jgi:hypothetical protein
LGRERGEALPGDRDRIGLCGQDGEGETQRLRVVLYQVDRMVAIELGNAFSGIGKGLSAPGSQGDR